MNKYCPFLLRFVVRGCALAVVATTAFAQGPVFPSQPIRIVVPYAPGGGTDLAARAVGDAMQTEFGVPVVIENVTGATGNIGLERAAAAAPDGYTLVLASAINTSNSATRPESSVDLLTSFRSVGIIGDNAFALVVSPKLGVKNVAELVAMAKANPGKLAAGSAGLGSSHHLVIEMFKAAAGVDIIHVPYRGESAVFPEVGAGRVQMSFLVSAGKWIENGQLKALATTAEGEWPPLPGVPSLASQGYPSMTIHGWNGLMAPVGTPDAIVAKLNAALNASLKTKRVQQVLDGISFQPVGGKPERMTDQISSDMKRFKEIIEKSHLKFD